MASNKNYSVNTTWAATAGRRDHPPCTGKFSARKSKVAREIDLLDKCSCIYT